jgi:hypothetical protein
MPYINGMLVQSDGSRPHVVYIMRVLAETFPNVIWKIGGKVPRTTAGGGFSAHSVGRACDIYLDANERLDKKLGDLLFNLFITEAVPLKVDHTIWDTRWSDDGGAPTTYTGSGGPHKNHVHVAFKDDRLNDQPLVFDRMCATVAATYSLGGGRRRRPHGRALGQGVRSEASEHASLDGAAQEDPPEEHGHGRIGPLSLDRRLVKL